MPMWQLRRYHSAYTMRLNKPRFLSNFRTVSTTVFTNCSKGPICGLNLLHTLELSPPQFSSPKVTTDQSSSIAAKAPLKVAWICCTPFSWSWTAKLSPPQRSAHFGSTPDRRNCELQVQSNAHKSFLQKCCSFGQYFCKSSCEKCLELAIRSFSGPGCCQRISLSPRQPFCHRHRLHHPR